MSNYYLNYLKNPDDIITEKKKLSQSNHIFSRLIGVDKSSFLNTEIIKYIKLNDFNAVNEISKEKLKFKYVSILFNIYKFVDPDSPCYIENYLTPESSYDDITTIVKMKFINTADWKTESLEYEKRLIAEENIIENSNSNLPCVFCHEKNISVKMVQTRSSDEGMTAFYNCHSCGRKWKN